MSVLRRRPRLRGRTLAEAADRTAQFTATLLERASLLDARELAPGSLERRLAAGWSVDGWIAALAAPARFFASCDDRDATVGALRAFAPDSVRRVIDRADRLLEGRFDLLGYRGLSFGEPVDWHLDPVAGVRSPRRHWSAVRYLDPRQVGDHKVVWELNRHHVLVTLAQARCLTSDERYAAQAARWLREWMDDNPPKLGVNWASSLEVGFRSIAWLWALHLLAGSPHLTPALARRALGFLYLSARHIARHLSTWFSPNTHLTGEALALFYLGTQLAMFREAAAWRERGAAILLDQLPRQVRPDGVYFEQATWYHRYTHDIYLHFLLLAERNGLPVRARVEPVLERMGEVLMAIARPDGSLPLIGDDDGGQLLSLDAATGSDVSAPLTADAVLFGREEFAALTVPPSGAAVWLLGPEAPRRFASVRPRPPSSCSVAFPESGVFVMRSGWDRETSVLVIDAGPHGSLRAGHAHADALAFDLSVGGAPVLVDPGTGTYTAEPEWRERFRATASHNAVTVDGEGSSVPDGPFSWRTMAHTTVSEWQSTGAADLLVGAHDGFERLEAPVRYERSVLFARDGYWIVCDRIESAGEHEVSAQLQCAPGIEAQAIDARTIRLTQGGAERLRVRVAGAAGPVEIRAGWVSPLYGERVPAPQCRYGTRVAGSGALVGVLWDSRHPRRVEEIGSGTGVTVRVAGAAADDLAHFAHGGAPLSAAGIESDAKVLWIRRTPEGEPVAWLAARATHLRVDGVELARRDEPGPLHGVLHSATPGAA